MSEKQTQTGKRILTGRKVLFVVLGFFGIILVANTFMITAAVSSFRGEDTKKSYLQGLNYNETLAKRHEQLSSGWIAKLEHEKDAIQIIVMDKDGRNISGLEPIGVLKHPTDTDLDIELVFAEIGIGVYKSSIATPQSGQRILTTKSQTPDGFLFETRNTLWFP